MRIILTYPLSLLFVAILITLITLSHIQERIYINEQEQTKKLLKCAYNAGKAGAPVSVREDNPSIISIVKGRSAWDNYGSAKQ